MSYWIFIEQPTGRQVEWNDEFAEWIYLPGLGTPAEHQQDVEALEVRPTGRSYQLWYEHGYPDLPYADAWPT